MQRSRRHFFGRVSALTLAALAAHSRVADAKTSEAKTVAASSGYSALRPVADQRGVVVLALPEGFTLTTFSRVGEAFDGGYVPKSLDGMAAFARPHGVVRLIRNHEIRNPAGNAHSAVPGAGYDASASGGCMVLDVDARSGKLVRQFVGLAGTHVNCAGGYAWKQSAWLTCEETLDGPKDGYAKKHGYVFAVPADTTRAVVAPALTAMGRFKHEAACADDAGTVYLTEDAGKARGSGFYRFLPEDRTNLARGGVLQILRVRNAQKLDAREGQHVGAVRPCDWVTITDPDPELESGAPGCFDQGYAAGGVKFNRLEGLSIGHDGKTVYFTSTSGGDAKSTDVNKDGFVQGYGQIWRYAPLDKNSGTLTLHFESPGGSALDSPDNLCVTPRGGLLMCEDDASAKDEDRHALSQIENVNRLVGLGRDGVLFPFAVNLLNDSELCGACFSPDGQTLFVNLYGDGKPDSGMSCAIRGPWARGTL